VIETRRGLLQRRVAAVDAPRRGPRQASPWEGRREGFRWEVGIRMTRFRPIAVGRRPRRSTILRGQDVGV